MRILAAHRPNIKHWWGFTCKCREQNQRLLLTHFPLDFLKNTHEILETVIMNP